MTYFALSDALKEPLKSRFSKFTTAEQNSIIDYAGFLDSLRNLPNLTDEMKVASLGHSILHYERKQETQGDLRKS